MQSLFRGLIMLSVTCMILVESDQNFTTTAQLSSSVNDYVDSVSYMQSTVATLAISLPPALVQGIAALTPMTVQSAIAYIQSNLTAQITGNVSSVLTAQYGLLVALSNYNSAFSQGQSYASLSVLAMTASTNQNLSKNAAQWATATTSVQSTLGAYSFYASIAKQQVFATAAALVVAQTQASANPQNQTMAAYLTIALAAQTSAITNAALFKKPYLATLTQASLDSSIAIDTTTTGPKAQASVYAALYVVQVFQAASDLLLVNQTAALASAWLAVNTAYDQYQVVGPQLIPQIPVTNAAIQVALLTAQSIDSSAQQINLNAQSALSASIDAISYAADTQALSNTRLYEIKFRCVMTTKKMNKLLKLKNKACKQSATKCAAAALKLRVASSATIQACKH